MDLYLQFAILGISAGAIYAALSLGLVLTYRASGVINFSHGAIAMYVAYTYAGLTNDGRIPIIPLPNPLSLIEAIGGWFGAEWELWDLPTFIEFPGSVHWLPALVLSLAVAALIGAAFHYLVFRPLRYQPALPKVVASVALMLMLQSAIVLRFGSTRQPLDNIFPQRSLDILGATIPVDRLILFGIVIVLTVALWALFRFTMFGLKTRAAAENEEKATILGVSADRTAANNWILASLLAGSVGILVAPMTGLNAINFTLFIIPALAAALMAQFTSFWVAALSGVAIGMGQSILRIMEIELSWVPSINLQKALPLVVIIAVMLLRGRALPDRGAVEVGRLPLAHPAPWRPAMSSLLLLGCAAVIVFAPFQYRGAMTNTMIGAILALSLVVVAGFVGQISLAQLAVGGVTAFAVSTFATDAGMPIGVAAPLAIGVAALFGLVIAIPALRVRGASLAIMTLAAGVAIEEMLLKTDNWFGSESIATIDDPSLFGLSFGPNSPFLFGDNKLPTPSFGLFVLVVTTIVFVGIVRLRQSKLGDRMLAVRANERAAASVGINVQAVKLSAFVISSALAGVAGVLTAYKLGRYGADPFTILPSLMLLTFAYLGGIATVSGAAWAGTFFSGGIGIVLFEQWFFDLGQYEAYLAGILLAMTVILYPAGVDEIGRQQNAKLKSWWARRQTEPQEAVS